MNNEYFLTQKYESKNPYASYGPFENEQSKMQGQRLCIGRCNVSAVTKPIQ